MYLYPVLLLTLNQVRALGNDTIFYTRCVFFLFHFQVEELGSLESLKEENGVRMIKNGERAISVSELLCFYFLLKIKMCFFTLHLIYIETVYCSLILFSLLTA